MRSGLHTYVLLRTTKDHSKIANLNLTANKVRAHVGYHESLVFSCLRLQRLGKARKLDSVNGLIVAVTAPSRSQLLSCGLNSEFRRHVRGARYVSQLLQNVFRLDRG